MDKKIFLCVFFMIFSFSAIADAGQNIGALGRIYPAGGIISLAGPPGDTIDKIMVKPGDHVSALTPLVVFASRQMLELDAAAARNNLHQAEASGAKAIAIQEQQTAKIRKYAERAIALQEAKVRSAKENHVYAGKALSRLLDAGQESFSAQQMEEREHQVQSAKINLDMAEMELASLQSNLDTDLALSRLELERLTLDKKIKLEQAGQQLEAAEKKLKQAVLAAPSPGTILEVLQKEGEKSGGMPIVRMADLTVMTVIAEVFQADILKMAEGMKATITSKSLPGTLTGTIRSVSRIISDPSKVANVIITLDDPEPASRLINLEVEVSIETND